MDRRLSDYLIAAFPRVFRAWQRRDFDQVSVTRQDCACLDGWYDLIFNLCRHLEQWIAQQPPETQDDYYVRGIKEKLGGLRVAMSPHHSGDVQALIAAAERHSFFTCEYCGAGGHLLQHERLLLTRCPNHAPHDAVPSPL